MKKQSPSFETEGTQPDFVRELLDAGRDAANDPAVSGYNVDAGLARHAALVQAGAPLPPWAEQLVASGSGAAVGTGAATVAKLATGKLVAGVALAVVAVGTIAAIVIGAPEEAARIAPKAAPVAPLAPDTKSLDNAPQPAPQAVAPEGDAVELDIAPITARGKRDVDSAHEARTAETDAKANAARGTQQSTKSLDALMEAVGKQQASKGHTTLAPNGTVARSESQQRARANEPSEASEPTSEQASSATTPAPVVDDTRLEREMGMLAVAQRVLKSDPARALRLAQQGEKEFSGSMFTQERQQVLLLALIELGRIGEAKKLAVPYLKRYPNGPFSDRLRSALAAAKPEN